MCAIHAVGRIRRQRAGKVCRVGQHRMGAPARRVVIGFDGNVVVAQDRACDQVAAGVVAERHRLEGRTVVDIGLDGLRQDPAGGVAALDRVGVVHDGGRGRDDPVGAVGRRDLLPPLVADPAGFGVERIRVLHHDLGRVVD